MSEDGEPAPRPWYTTNHLLVPMSWLSVSYKAPPCWMLMAATKVSLQEMTFLILSLEGEVSMVWPQKPQQGASPLPQAITSATVTSAGKCFLPSTATLVF